MGVIGSPPSVLPDISPTRREIELRHIAMLSINLDGCGDPISPLVGEMVGRPEGGGVGHQAGWLQ